VVDEREGCYVAIFFGRTGDGKGQHL
jgi:hypothetical protein